MIIDIFFQSGKWYISIDGRIHPRRFDTYQEAANVAALVPEWMANPAHKNGRTDK